MIFCRFEVATWILEEKHIEAFGAHRHLRNIDPRYPVLNKKAMGNVGMSDRTTYLGNFADLLRTSPFSILMF